MNTHVKHVYLAIYLRFFLLKSRKVKQDAAGRYSVFSFMRCSIDYLLKRVISLY